MHRNLGNALNSGVGGDGEPPAHSLPWVLALSPGAAFPQSVPSAHRALLRLPQRPAQHHGRAEGGRWLLCVPGGQCGRQHPGQGPVEGKRRYVPTEMRWDPKAWKEIMASKRCFSWILYKYVCKGGGGMFLRQALNVSKGATNNRLLVLGRDYNWLWKPLPSWGERGYGNEQRMRTRSWLPEPGILL